MNTKAIKDIVELYQLVTGHSFGLIELQRIYAATVLMMKYRRGKHGDREGDKRNESK